MGVAQVVGVPEASKGWWSPLAGAAAGQGSSYAMSAPKPSATAANIVQAVIVV